MSIIRKTPGRPGSACKKLFSRMGMESVKGRCRCDALAEEMDTKGADYIEEHLNHYIVEMRRSSEEWIENNRPKLKAFGFPVKVLIKQILLKCIRESRGESDIRDFVIDNFLDTFFPYQPGYEERPVELPTDLSERDRFMAANPFFWSEPNKNRISIRER